MITHVYTVVFTRELPDTRSVRVVKRALRQLFEADEVSTSDNRRFSFVTTIPDKKTERAIELFGREQRRRFVIEGAAIHEIR